MALPLGSAIMKHVGAPALTAVFAGVIIGGATLIGVAFLTYGVHSELSRWMSEGAAAIISGVALVAASLVIMLVARKAVATPTNAPQELIQPRPESVSSLLSSNLSEFARTAVIGISARRPIAMLAMAAALGTVMLMMSDAEKNTGTAHGRNAA